MTEKLLKMERRMSRQEAAGKIQALAEKIGDGKVELSSGEDSVDLHPADQVEFELEVEKEADGDLSIEVEVEWPEEGESREIEIE